LWKEPRRGRKTIEKRGKLRNHWKILIGEYIAEKMSVDQIPDKIKEIVEKLRNS